MVKALVPSGFTHQGGANVFINVLTRSSQISKPSTFMAGTEFNFGIWPAQEQTDFAKPIEFHFTLNAAKVSPQEAPELTFLMYDPSQDGWRQLPTKFNAGAFQLVASVRSFTPVAKDFPEWGGRTFFAVAKKGGNPEVEPNDTEQATVTRTVNLRAGPGTNYPIRGVARQGQQLELISQTQNGAWYQLSDGRWVAAFLVANDPELPIAESTPSPSTQDAPPTASPSTATTPTQTAIVTSTTATPVIHKIGFFSSAILSGTVALDFDKAAVSENVDGADALLQASAPPPTLLTLNGAQIAVMDGSELSFENCALADVSTATVNLGDLSTSAFLCMITSEQRVGRIQLRKSGNSSVSFQFVVWEQTSAVP